MKKLALVFCLLAFLPGCKDSTPASGLATVNMPVGSRTYTLEIAAKDKDRQKGLMQRDAMDDDHGMIFIFAGEEPRQFWMKNTRIPLDILYLDSAGRVVSVHRMEPYVTSGTSSAGPAKYAIELNAGQAAKAGVKVGDHIALPAAVKTTTADP